ncbi:sugar-proton symporter [Legionella wadsworthii]|uniref:Sugar-proton symporter n=1 Tax=Legionella wadsworthii TaxID=28088 RepID=A0A378LXE7_9GAMM|nr:sugar porter family MFS transporter [Legionella wadsworthii]STY31148.1 sugar-proton symporter [Legionella wadsworthii]
MNSGLNSFIFFIALIAGFGGFLFGFDSSVIADVKDQVMVHFSLSEWQWSQTVSISILGCVFGIPMSGYFADRISRRFLLKIAAAGIFLGTVFCALTHSFILLFIGRFAIGVCIGIASYIAPLFIAEIAPPNRRGTLVLLNGLTITFGQAIAYLIGYFLHDYSTDSWRFLLGFESIPALILFFGIHFTPHSPRWLMSQYGMEKTLNLLKRIRPPEYNIHQEIAEIQQSIRRTQNNRGLFKAPIVLVLAVGILLGIFQQLTGINAFMYFGPVIFESAGFYPISNAILATFWMGVINFLFTIVTVFCIDKLGRRFLLLSGTLIAALSLFVSGIIFRLDFFGQKFWILCSLSTYVMGYCISLGSLFWVLISEIYPLPVRGLAMSIATVVQWAANFVVSLSFLSLYQNLGVTSTFGLFGSLCVLAFTFIYLFVPETTGISLEKIEKNLLSGIKIRDIGQPVSKIKSKDYRILNE